MINLPFVSVNTCNILKLRLFMNNIQTPPLCAYLLLKKISFPHSVLHASSCYTVQWVSCKKIICGFLLLSHKNISCLLLDSRSPQTLSEIISKLFIMIYFYTEHFIRSCNSNNTLYLLCLTYSFSSDLSSNRLDVYEFESTSCH